MRFFSMFSGVGGFELGLEAGARDAGAARPVLAGWSEIDPWARAVHRARFPGTGALNLGDARLVVWEAAPGFDLLCAGFPCQSFSRAGRRDGFGDPRGSLFFEVLRAAGAKRPAHLLLENVRGLLENDGGRTFEVVLGTLGELGYRLEWEVLDSKRFGVPQSRERVYVVGHLGGGPARAVFPLGSQDAEDAGLERGVEPVASAVMATGDSGGSGWHMKIVAEPVVFNDHFNKTPHVGFSPTIRASDPPILAGARFRRLTPMECERLQGFPDGWTAEGLGEDGAPVEVPERSRYALLGNAVTVNVVRAVAARLFDCCAEERAR